MLEEYLPLFVFGVEGQGPLRAGVERVKDEAEAPQVLDAVADDSSP